MRLLTCLADHAGEVVSIDDLLNQVWSGIAVSSDSVYQAVASLRRLLGDDPKQPTYIATVPRLGYRMVATVSPWVEEPAIPIAQANALTVNPVPSEIEALDLATTNAPNLGLPRRALWAIGAVICLAVAVVFLPRAHTANRHHAELPVTTPVQVQKSIAVLPFSDLTEGMKEETFADGMTEEIIDRLSKIPGFKVPGAAQSFYFKGKDMKPSEIANSLGVEYVVDGSVRKAGDRVRVATRLMRADDGYVIWTETYDRPFGDILKVQDEIAAAVAKELQPAP